MPNQKPLKRLKFSPEDEAKVARLKDGQDDSVDHEWYIIAEFGYYFGYEGIRAILDNEIDLKTVRTLLSAADKVWYKKLVETSHGTLSAMNASQARQPSKTFKENTASYREAMRVKT